MLFCEIPMKSTYIVGVHFKCFLALEVFQIPHLDSVIPTSAKQVRFVQSKSIHIVIMFFHCSFAVQSFQVPNLIKLVNIYQK